MAGFVSSSTAGTSTGPPSIASIVCPAPASLAAGNQLVAVVSSFGGAGADLNYTASGWTVLAHRYDGSYTQSILARTATASEPSSYTFNFAATTNSGVNATIWNYGQPQGGVVYADLFTPVSGGGSTWPSIALSVNAYYLVGETVPNVSGTVSGMTQRTGVGPGSTASAMWDQLVSAGATGSRTSTSSGGSQAVGFHIAIGASTAPAAPTLVSPIGGSGVDATTVIPFQATYNSTDAQTMNAYAFRVKLSGGTYNYWNATSGALQAGIVWNTLATPVAPGGMLTLNLPAGILANGNTYNWSVASQESGANLQGVFAADATVVTKVNPTMTIIAPTGSITTTTAPGVAFSNTTASGTALIDYELIWETGAYGTTPGAGSQVNRYTNSGGGNPQPVLVNGTTYRLFGRVTQTGPQTGPWTFSTFTISVTPPNAPTLVATASTDPANGSPRVQLVATGHDTPPPFDFTHVATQFQYSTDNGVTWFDVRGASAVADVTGELATAYDYEARFGGPPMLYRAREVGTVGTDTLAGAWSASMPVTLYSSTWWIMDPLDPSSPLSAPLTADAGETKAITEDVLPILGSADPIISADVRQKATGSYSWLMVDDAHRAAFEALLARGRVLLMRTPNERADPGQCRYFRPTGTRTISRLGTGLIPGRQITTAFQTRDRP